MLSSHPYLGLPLGLVFKGFHLNIFLVALASGILCVWPKGGIASNSLYPGSVIFCGYFVRGSSEIIRDVYDYKSEKVLYLSRLSLQYQKYCITYSYRYP